jgi:hypothetical protein
MEQLKRDPESTICKATEALVYIRRSASRWDDLKTSTCKSLTEKLYEAET